MRSVEKVNNATIFQLTPMARLPHHDGVVCNPFQW
jgi:hypothetical protein